MTGHVERAPTPTIDRESLRQLPKAELHCHLDGSVRATTLIELGEDLGVVMPRQTPTALAAYMHVLDARHLEDYLERFEVTLAVMQTEAALERIAYELAIDAAADGVRYLEVRYCPVLNQRGGLSLGATVEAPLRGLARAERDTGIVARTIITALRTHDPKTSMELARLAAEYRGRGVVGFDLAGAEAGYPATDHVAAFAFAREHDVLCTCHAGEGDGAHSIGQAVHGCGVHRVGHATRLIEDEALMDYVGEHRIPLELCLTSNVQTRVARSYGEHPMRQYFDRGLTVVLNTDNRLMSGVTLTDEYAAANVHLGFTFDELCTVAMNGFASGFLPAAERLSLKARVQADLDTLRAAVT